MTLLVPRDAAGDLLAGARRRLDRVEAVRGVERMEVGGVRPGLNDVRVEVTAELRVAVDLSGDSADAAAAVADRLGEGFGVRSVAVAAVESVRGPERKTD